MHVRNIISNLCLVNKMCTKHAKYVIDGDSTSFINRFINILAD